MQTTDLGNNFDRSQQKAASDLIIACSKIIHWHIWSENGISGKTSGPLCPTQNLPRFCYLASEQFLSLFLCRTQKGTTKASSRRRMSCRSTAGRNTPGQFQTPQDNSHWELMTAYYAHEKLHGSPYVTSFCVNNHLYIHVRASRQKQ